MREIGFPNTRFEEEYRIALLPRQVKRLKHRDMLFFQKGYGERLGIRDAEYQDAGANITNFVGAYGKEVLCQPKFCEDDTPFMKHGQTIIGWIHLVYGSRTAKAFERRHNTVIEWANMYKGKDLVFARNNQLTGQTGVLHAIAYVPRVPEECKAAVLGNGCVGKGAKDELRRLGVKSIKTYNSCNIDLFLCNITDYDIIVHCAAARHQILTAEDLRRMKRGAVFVHLGSDCIKDRVDPRSIFSPVEAINQGKNLVYSINHVPTLPYQTSSRYISEDFSPYIDLLVQGEMDKTLSDAVIVDKGRVLIERL